MSPDKEIALEEAYETVISYLFHNIPISEMDIESVIAEDAMIYGTTVDEHIFGIDDFKRILNMQAKEMEGLEPRFERTTVFQRISEDETSALIVEEVKLTIEVGDSVSVSNVRISFMMEKLDGLWKLIHAHGSKPVETEEDPWHVKEWQQEKEKLEKLVAEQTTDLQEKNRELEIEAASERVRSVAMGMQEPDDIINVLNMMKEEVDTFELGNIATWIWTKDEDGLITQWDISEVIKEGNLVHFNLRFDIYDEEKNPEVHRHTEEWKMGKKYYALHWCGEKLQAVVDEVARIDPESGKLFQEAVDVGQIEDYWHAASPFSRGVVGLDFTSTPPEITESILLKMSSAFDMAYQRFEDLQKAEAQTREAQINLAVERVRARALAMFESAEILDVVEKLRDEIIGLDIPSVTAAAIHLKEPDGTYRTWDITTIAGEDGDLHSPVDIKYNLEATHPDFYLRRVWNNSSDYFEVIQTKEQLVHSIQWLRDNGQEETGDALEQFSKMDGIEQAYHPTVQLFNGRMNIDMLDSPTPEVETILKKMAGAFDLAYKRFEDLKASEKQMYESKVEASLERVRGMAAAMNHSDDLMQIAEAMFMEMEILKINPLRYGIGIIDGEKMEAELWASTVDDGHYLDMLGTISLTWHPMLQQVLDAWDAQHEEVIYELKGKELSDYYQKIGTINPDIPNLKDLQDPKTEIVQFVSFFPFQSGALYAFTNGEPGEDGKSILKRFAKVFEQAHIRYNDLQIAEKQARQIREERDRLADTLKELRATQEQLVQQEKLASLGQLTAGIAHEIKNPLNFVNNFSEVSIEMVEEAREEVRRVTEDRGPWSEKAKVKSEKGESPLEGSAEAERRRGGSDDEQTNDLILEILDDIEANLRKIHEHGSRADSIVKSMLEHSRGGDGTMEPTDLNALIKEYVNLSFHGMRAGKDPINVDIELDLDEGVGEIPLVAEDFSRVILNLCNNGFDAMREKSQKSMVDGRKTPFEGGAGAPNAFGTELGDDTEFGYHPKLTVRTKAESGKMAVEIKDNGPGIPEEIKDKIMQPFFTTKKGTEGTGLGLSITNDIVKAHGGSMDIHSQPGQTVFTIKLNG